MCWRRLKRCPLHPRYVVDRECALKARKPCCNVKATRRVDERLEAVLAHRKRELIARPPTVADHANGAVRTWLDRRLGCRQRDTHLRKQTQVRHETCDQDAAPHRPRIRGDAGLAGR